MPQCKRILLIILLIASLMIISSCTKSNQAYPNPNDYPYPYATP